MKKLLLVAVLTFAGGVAFADVAADKAAVEADRKALKTLFEQLRAAKKANDQATVTALQGQIKTAEAQLKTDEQQLRAAGGTTTTGTAPVTSHRRHKKDKDDDDAKNGRRDHRKK